VFHDEFYVDDEILFAAFPPFVFDNAQWRPASELWLRTLPIALSSVTFLVLARAFVVRRALLPPKTVTVAVFRALDRFWQRVNWLSGGVVLWRDRESLPLDKPVAWRELTKKSLGKPHYLFRMLVLTTVPVLIVMLFALVMRDTAGWRSHEP